jgi:hypothetical protein
MHRIGYKVIYLVPVSLVIVVFLSCAIAHLPELEELICKQGTPSIQIYKSSTLIKLLNRPARPPSRHHRTKVHNSNFL